MVTAKDVANMILALPEEQQNVPLIYTYYDDPESSISVDAEIESIQFYERGFPFEGPHISLGC